jgi:PAS domain S-box-containing protein/putative nucleotidyltransferase with HDIG domain
MRGIALAVLTVYPVATAVVCWLLLEDESRVATRDALAQSEQQLKLAIDASGTGLWDLDLEKGRVLANDQWAEMIGYRLEEMEPITFGSWTELVHPDDIGDALAEIARHVAGETPVYTTEFRMRHKDGHWAWIVANGRVTDRDRAGQPVRMTGTHIDITHRKDAEVELQQGHAQMEQMVHDVAEAMGRVVEARDPYTQGHEQRVATLARSIAERMGMNGESADEVEMAGLLHDVGKLHVPAEILTKPGKLSDTEFALIKEHPRQGHEILKDIAFPWRIAAIVLQHHERLDGSGYPKGLKGDEIMMPSRILAVADVVEAMASHRPYRPSLGLAAAIAEVRSHPNEYDHDVVAACVALHDAGLIAL